MNQLEKYIRSRPNIWMRNAALISLVWILPFYISNTFFNQNIHVSTIAGLIRTILSITFPMACIGVIWGTFEEGRLLKFFNSNMDDKGKLFRLTYFIIKLYEGAIAGAVFYYSSEIILITLMNKDADIISIIKNIKFDIGPIILGCTCGLIAGLFTRRKFLKLYHEIYQDKIFA